MAEGTRMQQRRATEAVWTTSDYVLAAGELGVTTDTGIIKVGNGTSPWSELDIAFGSEYLPILGKAADSELLDGIGAASFVKVADTSVTATNDSYVKRTADGGVKGSDATEVTELTTLAQLNLTDAQVTSLKVASVADRAARLALSTAGLRYGYTIRQLDTGYLWMWDLSAWRYIGKPNGDNPWCRVNRGSIAWGTTNQEVYGFATAENSDTNMFTLVAGTSNAAPGGITVTEEGKYRIMSYAQTSVGSGYYAYATHNFPSISSALSLSKLKSKVGGGIVNGLADFTIVDEGWLAAGQKVALTVSINVSGTLSSADLLVMRLPSL